MQAVDLLRPLLLAGSSTSSEPADSARLVADRPGKMQFPAEAVFDMGRHRLQGDHTGLDDIGRQVKGQAEAVGRELS